MLAEGRHIFGRRPKLRAAKPRVTIKTWQKPETALEKSLEPRVINHRRNFLTPVEFKITIYNRNFEQTLKMKPQHLCLLKQCMIITTYILIDPKKSWLCNVRLLHSSRKMMRKTWRLFLNQLTQVPRCRLLFALKRCWQKKQLFSGQVQVNYASTKIRFPIKVP